MGAVSQLPAWSLSWRWPQGWSWRTRTPLGTLSGSISRYALLKRREGRDTTGPESRSSPIPCCQGQLQGCGSEAEQKSPGTTTNRAKIWP